MSTESMVTQADHWVTTACPICGVGKSEPCVDTMGHRHPSSHPERRVWSTFAPATQPERAEAAANSLVSDLEKLRWHAESNFAENHVRIIDAAIAALTTPAPAVSTDEIVELAEVVAVLPCETKGAEDLEPGCCRTCRARATLSRIRGEGE